MNTDIAAWTAEEYAKFQYARRAGDLFELETLYREIRDWEKAAEAHRAAVIAGHAAWAETRNPEPR